MKTFAWGVFGFAILIGWLCGFWYLMDKAVMAPMEGDPFHPAYSLWWIGAWALYTCLSSGIWVWLRSEGPLSS